MAFGKITLATKYIYDGWTAFNQLITDLLSVSNGKGASQIGIEDSAGNVAAINVEDAIAEIYTDTSNAIVIGNIFDEKTSTTTGTTWGYTGGKITVDNTVTTIADGTVAGLTDDDVNYVEIDPSDGGVKTNTTGFTTTRIPIRQITVASGVQTVSTDKRAWFSREPSATVAIKGVTELSTNDESVTGTSDTVVVTPGTLTARLAAPGEIGGTTPAAGNFTDVIVSTSFSGTAFLDEDDMSSDSDNKVSSQQAIKAYIDSSIPAGVTFPWGGTEATIPSGYLFCDGRAVSRTTYANLFTAIGTTHGVGDASTTFNLPPDGRHIIGAEGDSGNTYDSGDTGGSNTISSANLPTHTHDDGTLATDTEDDHTHSIPTMATTGSGHDALYSNGVISGTENTGSNGSHLHDVTGDTGDGGFANSDFELPYVVMPLIIKY